MQEQQVYSPSQHAYTRNSKIPLVYKVRSMVHSESELRDRDFSVFIIRKSIIAHFMSELGCIFRKSGLTPRMIWPSNKSKKTVGRGSAMFDGCVVLCFVTVAEYFLSENGGCPATRYKWTRPALTPASQGGTSFTYPGGMEGWVGLGSLIVTRPGIDPTTAWSHVWHPNRYVNFFCCVWPLS